MTVNFRFAIISDPHVTLSHTLWSHPDRFHLGEVSIPALESVLTHLEQCALDFILIPGDLTQHGEPDNHRWLQQRLNNLTTPVYVIPGNHDIPTLLPNKTSIGVKAFPYYYRQFGYINPERLYYCQEILPEIYLIGLNSNYFDAQGKQLGYVDEDQLLWLEQTLTLVKDKLVFIMIHHNVIEHIPAQSTHTMGKRYMIGNSKTLLTLLQKYGVKYIFTGHLHVQDVAEFEGIYEITTGSLVSYPHPYRILEMTIDEDGNQELQFKSFQVESIPGWEKLTQFSKQWMADRSYPFMVKLLTSFPLNLSLDLAETLAPQLRYFWSDIAQGDRIFDFPQFPPVVRSYFQQFSCKNPIDNQGKIIIKCA
jgi:3',5'-cyclic AMP phosphodiesterase CpdA